MSKLLYQVGVNFYSLLLKGIAPFHAKAAKMVAGRLNIFKQLEASFKENQDPVVWFHCASLGEFEQGRPLLEKFAATYPGYKILLTFFSPSGYEIRKNYPGAHYIFYLPLDNPANAKRFINLVKPSLAIFVKYEFWFNYLNQLHQRNIPVISVSAIFRPEQIFFKPYGGFYRNTLNLFTHIFTQNQLSADLLQTAGISQVTVAGDTRFDRVLQTAAAVKAISLVEHFKADKPVFVIGSSWPHDIEVLLPFIKKYAGAIKFIIAPHEIHEQELTQLLSHLEGKAIRFSKALTPDIANYPVLLIDNIGMLSSLYSHGTYAYIGGAFGKGLHNTLEAATFGLPLYFGPSYQKFQEAIDLVQLGVAFPIQSTTELEDVFTPIYQNQEKRKAISEKAKTYVQNQAGATDIILHHVKTLI
ncbi:3-deoxy-D-manno-octulosonic acid transferase [Adhaeribacter aquaticus]|uniref:3-deoxy-D-manno-octulosonic acid transferase n=1 Tax=Adhaeribacter aquaticus TaxID=299567 RepID=UPI000426C61A|nr:glycosyltransferase N-terminal domain-containing protein [Adhaeribacter aquaticus]